MQVCWNGTETSGKEADPVSYLYLYGINLASYICMELTLQRNIKIISQSSKQIIIRTADP